MDRTPQSPKEDGDVTAHAQTEHTNPAHAQTEHAQAARNHDNQAVDRGEDATLGATVNEEDPRHEANKEGEGTPQKAGDAALGATVNEEKADSVLLPEQLPESTLVDGLEIRKRLGRGGAGVVYQAWDPELKREVALKLMMGGSAEAIERFKREAQAVARIKHPGVVAVHRVGRWQDRPYFVMDLVEGLPLDEYIQAHTEIQRRKRLEVFLELCEVVQIAHAKGVIHRDLKPANTMVEPDGTVKVLDFGLAKMLEDDEEVGVETADGAILGTPAYMAPEQAEGKRDQVDTRTDVFSLGVILYELLTGRRPFEGKSLVSIIHSVVFKDPAPLRSHGLKDEDLEAILTKALAKKPSQRYETVSSFAKDIRRWLAGEELSVRPRSIMAKTLAFMRRHYLSVAAMVLVALGVASLLAYNAYQRAARLEELVDTAKRHARALKKRSNALVAYSRKRRRSLSVSGSPSNRTRLVQGVERETIDALAALRRALEIDLANQQARTVMVKILLQRIHLAEKLRKPEVKRMYLGLLKARFPNLAKRPWVEGVGKVRVGEKSRGASVSLWRFQPDTRGVLREKEVRDLGEAPLGPISLPQGSYLLLFEKEGFATARVPVVVERGEEAHLDPVLLRPHEIPRGYVYVPAGPAIVGNPNDTYGDTIHPWKKVATRP